MPINLRVKDEKELKQMIDNKDINISRIICNSILKNINTSLDKVHVLSVELLDEDKIIDMEVKRGDFYSVLNKNLNNFIKHEDYEFCLLIKKALEKLSNETI